MSTDRESVKSMMVHPYHGGEMVSNKNTVKMQTPGPFSKNLGL